MPIQMFFSGGGGPTAAIMALIIDPVDGPIPAPIGNVTGLDCYAPAAIPKESRVISTTLDFRITHSYEISFTEIYQRGLIDKVQTLYVDNKDNTVAIDFLVAITGQRITIPAGYQGFLPVLLGKNINSIYAYSADAGVQVQIQLLNFFVPTTMWNATL